MTREDYYQKVRGEYPGDKYTVEEELWPGGGRWSISGLVIADLQIRNMQGQEAYAFWLLPRDKYDKNR